MGELRPAFPMTESISKTWPLAQQEALAALAFQEDCSSPKRHSFLYMFFAHGVEIQSLFDIIWVEEFTRIAKRGLESDDAHAALLCAVRASRGDMRARTELAMSYFDGHCCGKDEGRAINC